MRGVFFRNVGLSILPTAFVMGGTMCQRAESRRSEVTSPVLRSVPVQSAMPLLRRDWNRFVDATANGTAPSRPMSRRLLAIR